MALRLGATISVPLGGAVTCTINNNDNGPQLKLVKTVMNDNGGTAEAKDFTLSATSTGPNASRDFTSATNTPAFHDVFAAVGYTLAEQGPAGYPPAVAVHGRHAGRQRRHSRSRRAGDLHDHE